MASSTARAGRPNNNALLVLFAFLSALGLYHMRIYIAMNDIPRGFLELVQGNVLPNGVPIKKDFTGITVLDEGLSFLVIAFLYGPTKWNEHFYWQQFHFLFQIASLIAIMNVEACRERNQGSWLKYTAIWALVYQNVGGAVIAPLWFLLFYRISKPTTYFQAGRAVPFRYASAILPGVVLFFVVPTIAMFIPGHSLDALQASIAFWQFGPIFVNIPLWIISYFPSAQSPASKFKTADLPHLKILYAFCFALCVVVHLCTIYGISTSANPDVTFAKVFVPSTYTWADSFDWGLLYVFQWDWVIWGLCMVISAWVAVCDVQRVTKGEVTYESLLGSFIVVMAIAVGGGPGAAMAGVWYWREEKLAALEGGSGMKKVQ